jgi:hypothetical protein
MSSLSRTALLVAALFIAGTNGFVAPSPSKVATSRIGTELYIVERTGFDSFANARPIKDVSYGEESRQYRRTVYSHDDWVKHRSPDRFIYYLGAMVSSGVYKNLGREVTLTTAVAAFVCLWNALTGEYQDLDGVKHAGVLAETLIPMLTLPLAPFTLASPSLGLLLGKFVPWWRPRVEDKFMCRCSNLFCFFAYHHFSLPYKHLLPTLG